MIINTKDCLQDTLTKVIQEPILDNMITNTKVYILSNGQVISQDNMKAPLMANTPGIIQA